MVTDGQVKKLYKLVSQGKTLATAARMAGMDEKTARKYRKKQQLPSQMKKDRSYRTRRDPFQDVWSDVVERLQGEPSLRAITLFRWLQKEHPGRFPESQRRTFERRVRTWRATEGPGREVRFPQRHSPGVLAASDFTSMNSLSVTIRGRRFEHMVYHFVLTYSNWECVSLCYSESFESLSRGFQEAVWSAGGVPHRHRSDSLTAAVNNLSDEKTFQKRYQDLMDYYGTVPEHINAGKAHENGDVESSHGHFKRAVNDALLLRGSRDFESVEQYVAFLKEIERERNAPRQEKFRQEQTAMKDLPPEKLDYRRRIPRIRVSSSSTIRVLRNTYSVPSRLIGESVNVVIDADTIDVYYGDHHIQAMRRLTGHDKHAINYRHVIDSLVRKPGAFADYQYQEDMFPSSYFRMAYDELCRNHSERLAVRKYLTILHMAAHESEEAVEQALRIAIQTGEPISPEWVRQKIEDWQQLPSVMDVSVEEPDLGAFDVLLSSDDMEVITNEYYQEPEVTGQQDAASGAGENLGVPVDGEVSGTPSSHVPGALHDTCHPSDSGELESGGVPGGADGAGMSSQAREPHCSTETAIAASFFQDMGPIQLEAVAAPGCASVREPSGRLVFGSAGESPAIWQTRFGEDPLPVCAWGTIDSTRPIGPLYDLQPSGAAVAGGQTGLATLEPPEASRTVRGAYYRRPGLCSAEPRRDGSPVHVTGGAIRTRECASDKQSAVLEVGADLQGRHDDGSRHRPACAPQRGDRAQCVELPAGDRQTQHQEGWAITPPPIAPAPGSLIVAKAEL